MLQTVFAKETHSFNYPVKFNELPPKKFYSIQNKIANSREMGSNGNNGFKND
jgi:hypothetical protein